MKTSYLFLIAFLLLSTPFVHGNNLSIDKEQAKQLIQHQPVQFLENKGQMTDMNGNSVPFVLFKTSTPGLDIFITEKGITYVFEKTVKKPMDIVDERGNLKTESSKQISWERIEMSLEGSTIKKENIIKEGKSPNFSQYFLPHCPDGITGVHNYKKITIKEVYQGIDWVFYNSNEKGFKYDFIVHPGANPDLIQLIYSSLHPIALNSNGGLDLKSNLGSITEGAPYSYIQETSNQVNSSFNISNQQLLTLNNEEYYQTTISFNFSHKGGDRKAAFTLIIDPQLTWATFTGGSMNDVSLSVTSDNSGNIFVTGYTTSPLDFPINNTGAFFQGTLEGSGDIFFMKFNNTGALLWSTYYGGTGDDRGYSIATDGNGNIFVTGITNSPTGSFPLEDAGTFYQGTYGGNNWDAFILKFDNFGNRLWATYYGGNNTDSGYSIDTDLNDNVLVTGSTRSTDLSTNNAGQAAISGQNDAFILKFSNAGVLLWGTYYGGTGNDNGTCISSDMNGNILLTGYTNSTDFPLPGTGTFQNISGGSYDIFILKFNNLGNPLWGTYYGGNEVDIAVGIVVDSNNDFFISGNTNSTNFPVQNAGTFFQGLSGGGWDALILKFDNNGNRIWATHYGESGDETFNESFKSIAIDACGNVYMCFDTESTNILTQVSCDGGYYDNTHNGGLKDNFIVKFSNAGVLLWASYLGGDGLDSSPHPAVDNSGTLFICGRWEEQSSVITNSTYPLINPGSGAYYDDTFNGGADGFIVKFNKTPPFPLSTAIIDAGCICNGTAIVDVNGNCAPYSYVWSNGKQTLNTNNTSDTASGLCPGTYTITAYINCDTLEATYTITGIDDTLLLSSEQTTSVCSGLSSATVNASGGTLPYSYVWNPSMQMNATAISLSSGTYTVTITDKNGCSNLEIITIDYSKGPNRDIFIPNAFSPDNNEENDKECVYSECIELLTFIIYNRWGEKVFETTDPGQCWDGTYRGDPLDTDVFVYHLRATLFGGEIVNRRGNISLIR